MKMTKVTSHSVLLASAALALALSLLCLMVFRGPASLGSALIVPAILVLFSRNGGNTYYLLVSSGLLLATLLLVQPHLIFAAGYLLLAQAIRFLLISPTGGLSMRPVRLLLYVIAASGVLFLGIWLTEILFQIPLHQMMLRISGQNPWVYLVILLVEGFLVGLANIAIFRLFSSRVQFFRSIT